MKYVWRLAKAALMILVMIELTMCGCRPVFTRPLTVTEPIRQSQAHLQETVNFLSEDIGIRNYMNYDKLNQAGDYIDQAFQSYGYEVVRQNYTMEKKVYSNIIAKPKGLDESKGIVVVGAHYDSCFNPGADDNASGIAGILELARLMHNDPLASQIELVAFTNEEPPFFSSDLMGSRVYAHWLHKQGIKVKAAVVLEMIGYYSDKPFSQRYLPLMGLFYPNQGNFIAVVGNFPSGHLVGQVVKAFKHSSKFPIESIVAPSSVPGIYYSDHSSFWTEGYPAVMVTDTAYLRNKNYHKMTDRVKTLNFEKMAFVVHGLKEAIIDLTKK